MERNDVIFVHLSALDSFVQIGTKFGKLGKLENKDDLIYCSKVRTVQMMKLQKQKKSAKFTNKLLLLLLHFIGSNP